MMHLTNEAKKSSCVYYITGEDAKCIAQAKLTPNRVTQILAVGLSRPAFKSQSPGCVFRYKMK